MAFCFREHKPDCLCCKKCNNFIHLPLLFGCCGNSLCLECVVAHFEAGEVPVSIYSNPRHEDWYPEQRRQDERTAFYDDLVHKHSYMEVLPFSQDNKYRYYDEDERKPAADGRQPLLAGVNFLGALNCPSCNGSACKIYPNAAVHDLLTSHLHNHRGAAAYNNNNNNNNTTGWGKWGC